MQSTVSTPAPTVTAVEVPFSNNTEDVAVVVLAKLIDAATSKAVLVGAEVSDPRQTSSLPKLGYGKVICWNTVPVADVTDPKVVVANVDVAKTTWVIS